MNTTSTRGKSTVGLIAIAITGLFLTLLTSGVLTPPQNVPAKGTVTTVNIDVYTDSTYTINCTNINWGTLAPGTAATRNVYVKNTGAIPVTLSMTSGNWTPSNANDYLTLTWNLANQVLAVNASVQATFTLAASTSAGNITSFNFDIVITGTE